MKIRTKITLPIVFATAIILTIASVYSYFVTADIVETAAIQHLETTAQLMEKHIETYLIEQKGKIEIAATHGELSIEELQEIFDINPEFYEIFVINSEGIIITSTDQSHVGFDRSDDAYFLNARNKTYIKPSYFSKETQKNNIAVATPHAGGVLVARIELEYFDNIVSDRTGLGETGESLLAYREDSGNPVFFTQRRFSEESDVEDEEMNIVLPIEEAMNKNENIFFEYDYRHVPVIAVTRYIEEVDMGLVVKIDQEEALAASKQILIFSIIRIFLVLFIFFIIIYLDSIINCN